MITNITLIIACLVVLNFLLLIFSCNKTKNKESIEVKSVKQNPDLVTSQLDADQLAATGS